MNRVFVSHTKNDKNFAKKLVSKLESSGVKCLIGSRDKSSGGINELIEKSNIFILILSKSVQNSKEIIEQLKFAYDNNCHIIPVKTENIDTGSMSIQYFLHTLEWVDVHEDGFKESFEILLEIIEEISGNKVKKQNKVSKPSASDNNFTIKPSFLYAIIILLSLAVLYLLFFNNSNKNSIISNNKKETRNENIVSTPPDFVNSKINSDEQKIIGIWKMVDYEDSRILSAEEKKLTEQNVEALKKRVLLTFSEDRSFKRAGFTPQVQNGYWEYDNKKRKIFLTPANTNKKEEINILSLTDKEMIFVVTELINEGSKTQTVTTKIIFNKQ